eukprot:3313903-Rhodomonas_salina.2
MLSMLLPALYCAGLLRRVSNPAGVEEKPGSGTHVLYWLLGHKAAVLYCGDSLAPVDRRPRTLSPYNICLRAP